MRREKLEALKKEFPFLTEILNKTEFDLEIGQIRVARLDTQFLNSVPTSYYWSGVAGRHTVTERLFAVENDSVREIPLTPKEEAEIAGGYDRHYREGQTTLASLIEAKCFEPDFLIFYSSEKVTYTDDQDSNEVIILKPMKGATISQVWDKALRKAELKIKEGML